MTKGGNSILVPDQPFVSQKDFNTKNELINAKFRKINFKFIIATIVILVTISAAVAFLYFSKPEKTGFSCAYQPDPTQPSDSTIITYSKSESEKFSSGMNLTTGIFKTTVEGVYSVSFGYQSTGSSQVRMVKNDETILSTSSNDTAVGRSLFLALAIDDRIQLECSDCQLKDIYFCLANF